MLLGITFVIITLTIIILIVKHFVYVGPLKSLENKHVVITGGSSGIGKGIAIECAKRGAHVTIIARNVEKLQEAVNEIKTFVKNKGIQKINYESSDVTNQADIAKKIQSIDDKEPIYMFVNCAGMALFAALENMSIKDIDTVINLNLYGTLYPTRAVIPLLKSRQEGIIVITSSQGGLLGVYGGGAYSTSKFALRGLAEVLYFETKSHNISITLALPADTDTPGFENEEKTKPIETRLISEEGGLLKPNDVGTQIVIDALRSRFYSYCVNPPTFCLSMSAAGMSPPSGYGELILQILLLGPLRLIGFFYIKSFERIIEKCKMKQDKEKKLL